MVRHVQRSATHRCGTRSEPSQLVQDATPEAVGAILAGDPNGTLHIRDELAGVAVLVRTLLTGRAGNVVESLIADACASSTARALRRRPASHSTACRSSGVRGAPCYSNKLAQQTEPPKHPSAAPDDPAVARAEGVRMTSTHLGARRVSFCGMVLAHQRW